VLDTGETPNVTPDWERALTIFGKRWYRKMKNTLIPTYVDRCHPMDASDLEMELCIAVAGALPQFDRTASLAALRIEKGPPMLSTFLWRVMENRLKNLARAARRRVRTVPLVLEGEEGIPNEPVWEPDFALGIDLRDALASIPDAYLLLAQVAGYADGEVAAENSRMRRHRAKQRLESRLAWP
jgi:DNA-directed RNA polymerase specialized sigma24 family protein